MPSCGTVDDEGNLYLGFKDGTINLYNFANNFISKKYQFGDGISFPITSVFANKDRITAASGRVIKRINSSNESATVGTHISL